MDKIATPNLVILSRSIAVGQGEKQILGFTFFPLLYSRISVQMIYFVNA